MTSRSGLAAFIAMVCCAIAARAEPALPASSGNVVIVQMHISSNGVTRYLYKGKVLSDVDLKRLETNAGKAHRRVEYDLELDEQAKSKAYDNRSTHIGFTGVNPGPDPQTSTHPDPSPQQPRHGD